MMNRKDAESLVAALRAFVRAEIANAESKAGLGNRIVAYGRSSIAEKKLVDLIMRMSPMEAPP